MKTIRINVTKIDKSALFKGEQGIYLDLVLFENKDGTDQYGNDGFVTQDIGKERRKAGERGTILGNWREIAPRGDRAESSPPGAVDAPRGGDDDIPF